MSKIVKVIDHIAFQRNMLALNAALEAAGTVAPDMGTGSASDEVRSLVQRSPHCAKEAAASFLDATFTSRQSTKALDASNSISHEEGQGSG